MRDRALAVQAAVLVTLTVKVISLTDNCIIPWIRSGKAIDEPEYTFRLSVRGVELGNEQTYFPDSNYDINITHRNEAFAFANFYFMIWNSNESKSYGNLEIRNEKLSKFNTNLYCTNRIIDGPVSLPKTSLTIGWRSPPRYSGCINMKLYVRETDHRYHVTNKTFCEDKRIEEDDPGKVINCRTCESAKYEMTFEGLWSKYYHPRHFPKKDWLAVFPSIVGATHANGSAFWQPYTKASNGLAEYAVTGNTIPLELEIKKKKVHTLIKFKGANFQNRTNKAYASFQTSVSRHVLSLVARLDPSTDWFIGVNSMELCLENGTWMEKKILNLYAYDAGVRDGIVYQPEVESETMPQDTIQSLNMTWPPPQNHVESPFYNAKNNTHEVRALAKIHLKRVRTIVTTQCEAETFGDKSLKEQEDSKRAKECVSDWSEWSNCTAPCGVGIVTRNRTLKEERDKSLDCTAYALSESKTCKVDKTCTEDVKEIDCLLTEWGEWRQCSLPCGPEVTVRTRAYKWPEKQQACEETLGKKVTTEHQDCGNPLCPDLNNDIQCNAALYTPWEGWTPCSARVGTGITIGRRRLKSGPLPEMSNEYGYSACLYFTKECDAADVTTPKPIIDPLDNSTLPSSVAQEEDGRPAICNDPQDEGTACENSYSMNSHRFYFDPVTEMCKHFVFKGCGGNKNRFDTRQECEDMCFYHIVGVGKPIDCQLSEWSEWQPEECNGCRGERTRYKTKLVQPKNGGKECPPRSEQKQIERCEYSTNECMELLRQSKRKEE